MGREQAISYIELDAMTDVVPEIRLSDQYNLTTHFLDSHLRDGRGEKAAIVCGDRQWSYRQVAALTNRVGNGLLAAGLESEQRVLLVLPDGPEFVASYLGALKIGAVAVPTNTTLRANDYRYFLEESRARIAIVDSGCLDEFEPAAEGQRHLKRVVSCGTPSSGHLGWDQFLEDMAPELEPAPTNGDDTAFWLWTSGSTGKPKAAVHRHHDWAYCAEYYARGVLGITADDRTFSSSKLFHAYGLGNGLLFPFYVGATTILYPGRPRPDVVLETVGQHRPTLFFSVPTLYAAMLQETVRNDYDLGSVRLAISAAEPLPAEIFKRWNDVFGVEILDGIGSTEVLHIYLSSAPGRVRAGSTGQAVPGYELVIVDDDGKPVPAGTIGDLMVAGPSTAGCYWNRTELSRDRMRGRWFYTGDKYSVDSDGYYWYAGRSDDMFRVSGQWVSPIEVEFTLVEHPAVLEAAVVAFEDDGGLLKPKAFVVVREGQEAGPGLAAELQDFVKQRITRHKYPRRIEFLSELPKTAAGKILRYKLRDAAGSTGG